MRKMLRAFLISFGGECMYACLPVTAGGIFFRYYWRPSQSPLAGRGGEWAASCSQTTLHLPYPMDHRRLVCLCFSTG